jgi:hypothetical protein
MLALMETSKESNVEHDGKSIAVLTKYVHSVAELLAFTSMKYFYYSLLVDTEVAIYKALSEYKESKNPSAVNNILKSFLDGMSNAISGIVNVFSEKD